MRKKWVILFYFFSWLLTACFPVSAQQPEPPVMQRNDRVRIAEAWQIGRKLGSQLWDNWNETPFALLLVTDTYEFLVGHPNPPDDFVRGDFDALLGKYVYVRPASFSKKFLATFAVNGVSTVVVGQPKQTGQTSTQWIITLLHEHFHQLQNSRRDYFSSVEQLNISGGDQSGMWMLNYPFPYDSATVNQQYRKLSNSLILALKSRKTPQFEKNAAQYFSLKEQLKELLNEKDYKYLSFQLWQEGIARYTELKIAQLAGKLHTPSKALQAIPDFKPFTQVAKELEAGVLTELQEMTLAKYQRIAFYATGAGEGLLLDEMNPDWRKDYFVEKFYTEKYVRIELK